MFQRTPALGGLCPYPSASEECQLVLSALLIPSTYEMVKYWLGTTLRCWYSYYQQPSIAWASKSCYGVPGLGRKAQVFNFLSRLGSNRERTHVHFNYFQTTVVRRCSINHCGCCHSGWCFHLRHPLAGRLKSPLAIKHNKNKQLMRFAPNCCKR